MRRIGGRWCYVILRLDFQSSPDRVMAIRLLAYIAMLLLRMERERKRRKGKPGPLPLILPIVIYLGEKRWSAPLDALSLFTREGMPIPEPFRRLLPALEYILVDVRRLFQKDKRDVGFLSDYTVFLKPKSGISP